MSKHSVNKIKGEIFIGQVRENKSTGHKYVTVPQRYSNIRVGDFVKVIKVGSDDE